MKIKEYVRKDNLKDLYPLSPLQEGMLFEQLYEDVGNPYYYQTSFRLEGNVNLKLFRQSFETLVNKYDVLRTVFFYEKTKQPLQGVLKEVPYNYHDIDLTMDSLAEATSKIEEYKKNDASSTLHLGQDSLFKCTVFKLKDNIFEVVWGYHHIILDGWSQSLVMQDFYQIYYNLSTENTAGSIENKSFSTYIKWLMKQDRDQAKAFWKNYMDGYDTPIKLPSKKSSNVTHSYNIQIKKLVLSDNIVKGLENLSSEAETTLNRVFQLVWGIVLARLNHTNDVMYGTIVSGRPSAIENVEQIVGLFINTIPIRVSFDEAESFIETLKRLHNGVIKGESYQYLSLADIQKLSSISGKLLEHNLVYQNFSSFSDSSYESESLGFDMISTSKFAAMDHSNFEIQILPDSITGLLEVNLLYVEELYPENYINKILQSIENILTTIIANPKVPLIDIQPFTVQDQIKFYLEENLVGAELDEKILINKLIQKTQGRSETLFRLFGCKQSEYDKIYPMMPTQEDYLNHRLIISDSERYNVSKWIDIETPFDSECFENCLNYLTQNIEYLRTHIVDYNGHQYLGVKSSYNHKYEYYENFDNMDELLNEITFKPYNLNEEPPYRFVIIKLSDSSYRMLFCGFNVFFDGLSITEIFNRVSEYYTNGEQKHSKDRFLQDIFPTRKQYSSKSSIEYWKKTGERFNAVEQDTYNASDKEQNSLIHINDEKLNEIKEYCKAHIISLPNFFRTLYSLLLRYYRGDDGDILLFDVYGLRKKEQKQSIGFYLNTIATPLFSDDLKEKHLFSDIVEYVKTQKKESNKNRFVTASEMLGSFNTSNTRYMFNYYYGNHIEFMGKTHHGGFLERNDKNEVYFFVEERSTDVNVIFNFNESSFSGIHFSERFEHVLNQILKNEDITTIDYLLDSEKEWYKSIHQVAYEEKLNGTFIDHFQSIVKQFPEHTAVEFETSALSYSELDNKSNELANYLITEHSITSDDIIPIVIDRSIDMVVSIIAAWKAGAAYTPVDPEFPEERITYILKDVNAKVVITDSYHMGSLGDYECDLFIYDFQINSLDSVDSFKSKAVLDGLAYIIYTSGSTGAPKGAMVEHLGMTNHMYSKVKDLELTSDSIVSQNASQCFDISVWQLFCAHLVGGKTIIYPTKLILEPTQFLSQLNDDKVTILEVVPSYLQVLIDTLHQTDHRSIFKSLLYLLVTGETLKTSLVDKWFELYAHIPMVNAYGPTEASDDITHCILTEPLNETDIVPVGHVLPNLHIYIMDKHMNILPPGIKGEICVAGVGVGRGYLNNPEKTNHVFLKNVSGTVGGRLYRTGDVGCFSEDGAVQFFGRKDHQIKINGYRIELGEIENQLIQCTNIKDAVVINHVNDKGTELCAYYISSDKSVSIDDIRKELGTRLPFYMVPNYFMEMDEFPLTNNGKVDRKNLPSPSKSDVKTIETTELTQEERIFLTISEEILGKSVSVTDNYFEVGGDSIKAIQIVSKLKNEGYSLEIKDIFEHQIIKNICNKLSVNNNQSDYESVEGEVSLTPIQLFFFDSHKQKRHHFNQHVLLNPVSKISYTEFKQVVEELVKHHDGLRTIFTDSDSGKPSQNITEYKENIYTEYHDFSDAQKPFEEMKKNASSLQEAFNLKGGPLFKAVYYKLKDEERLLFLAHHLIIDTVSWRFLMDDFDIMYKAISENKVRPRLYKTSSIIDWTDAINNYAMSETIDKEVAFWKRLEEKSFYQFDRITTSVKSDAISKQYNLSENDTIFLKDNIQKIAGVDVQTLLMNVFATSFNHTVDADNILIGLESHGRANCFDGVDVNKTVGWFTSFFPTVVETSKDISVKYLQKTKKDLTETPNYGIGYQILKYISPEETKTKLTYNLVPEIVFNYLGEIQETSSSGNFELAGEDVGENQAKEIRESIPLEFSTYIIDNILYMSLNNDGSIPLTEFESLFQTFQVELERAINFLKNEDMSNGRITDHGLAEKKIQEVYNNNLRFAYNDELASTVCFYTRIGATEEQIEAWLFAHLEESLLPAYYIPVDDISDFNEAEVINKVFVSHHSNELETFVKQIDSDERLFNKQYQNSTSKRTNFIKSDTKSWETMHCGTYIDRTLNKDTLEKTIAHLVEKYDVLRAQISSDNNWQFSEFDENINVPNLIIDLTLFHPEDKEKAIMEVIENGVYKQFDSTNVCYFRCITFKLTHRSFIVFTLFDHLIADGVSLKLFDEDLRNSYYRLNSGQELIANVASYEAYLNQISRGPIGYTDGELIKEFSLDKYATFANQINPNWNSNKVENKKKQKIVFSKEKLNECLGKQADIDHALSLFCFLAKALFKIDQYPVSIVYNGRRYAENNYPETIGYLADNIPFFITDDHVFNGNVYEKMLSCIEKVAHNNISFSALKYNPSLNESFKKSAEFSDNLPLVFNYQGYVDKVDEDSSYLDELREKYRRTYNIPLYANFFSTSEDIIASITVNESMDISGIKSSVLEYMNSKLMKQTS